MREAHFRRRDEDRGNWGLGNNPGLEPKTPGPTYAPTLLPHVLSINALGMIAAWRLPGRSSEMRGSKDPFGAKGGGN